MNALINQIKAYSFDEESEHEPSNKVKYSGLKLSTTALSDRLSLSNASTVTHPSKELIMPKPNIAFPLVPHGSSSSDEIEISVKLPMSTRADSKTGHMFPSKLKAEICSDSEEDDNRPLMISLPSNKSKLLVVRQQSLVARINVNPSQKTGLAATKLQSEEDDLKLFSNKKAIPATLPTKVEFQAQEVEIESSASKMSKQPYKPPDLDSFLDHDDSQGVFSES